MLEDFLNNLKNNDFKTIARAISIVENESAGYDVLLESLPPSSTPVIGITGPPGAGKSTITDGLIAQLTQNNKKVCVLCVDPSSPFNLGAVLGDRIRMSQWYNSENVFIRSLATRGSMGGLNPKILEITSLVQASAFDFIIIETVGVGQSEIEIAGLADVTIVVVVPEAGDEIQTMKAGLMEIADIFVVNKSDRQGADTFVKNLKMMLAPVFSEHREIPVIKTIASKNEGLQDLKDAILKMLPKENKRKLWLNTEKAFQLIQKKRMSDLSKDLLASEIEKIKTFNLHRFVKNYIDKKKAD